MQVILFILFLLLCLFIITRSRFLLAPGLNKFTLICLFLIKFTAGGLLGWIYSKYTKGGGDYWALHRNGLKETNLLLTDPKEFLAILFKSPYEYGWGGFFDSVGSFWNDLRNTIIEKLLGIINIFTLGNFYSNTLLLDFFGLLGHVALYRMFIDMLPGRNRAIIVGCFLLPSALIFSSGIHKDLFAFTLMSFFCYSFYFLLLKKATTKRSLILIFSLIGILMIRNYILIALLPSAIAIILTLKLKWKTITAFIFSYVSFIIISLILTYAFPGSGPLDIIARKHEAFYELDIARSQLPMFALSPDIFSFIANSPSAITNTFFSPFIWQTANKYHLFFSIELLTYWIIVITFLFRKRKNPFSPYYLFLICFCLIGLLFIGYIVPNAGSIIRYRSLYLPLLLTPIIASLSYLRD